MSEEPVPSRRYSRTQITAAGNTLKDRWSFLPEQVSEAEQMLAYWRLIHLPVLNTFQSRLRTLIAKKFKGESFVTQRLKREPSIVTKLQRYRNTKLSRMQDIAGVRAVVTSTAAVIRLATHLKQTKTRNTFLREIDYIQNPKRSGYRSWHLVFSFDSELFPESKGLQVEIQVRSYLQHIWATSVETMSTLLKTPLKSSEGPDDILEYFALASSAFASMENTPLIPGHNFADQRELFIEVVSRYDALEIAKKLQGFSVAVNHLSRKPDNYYVIIILDLTKRVIKFKNFAKTDFEDAIIAYTEIEREISSGADLQAVLVSFDTISQLKKAYPNFFLDTKAFIRQIERMRDVIEFNSFPHTF